MNRHDRRAAKAQARSKGTVVVMPDKVPPEVADHLDAVLKHLAALPREDVRGVDVIASIDTQGQTGILLLPPEKRVAGLEALVQGHSRAAELRRELGSPCPSSRTRITFLGARGLVYFTGMTWADAMSPGGSA